MLKGDQIKLMVKQKIGGRMVNIVLAPGNFCKDGEQI